MGTERGGFEPPLGVTPNLISSQAHSTTLPPLLGAFSIINPFIPSPPGDAKYPVGDTLVGGEACALRNTNGDGYSWLPLLNRPMWVGLSR